MHLQSTPRGAAPARGATLALAASLFAVAAAPAGARDAEASSGGGDAIGEGKKVSLEYTLKLDDGRTADSNIGGEPLVYEQGKSQILPKLEAALVGLQVDDTKAVVLTPGDGYGEIDPSAYQKVPIDQIPEGARKVGAMLLASNESGAQRPIRVHEVGETEITIDFNHPLAGQTLHFDVKVLSIE